MTKKKLNQEDVAKLLSDPSAENRVDTAAKVAGDFNSGALSDSERQMAQEIFNVMVKDAEVRVREALAINLKDNPYLSHDLALTLARDVDQVAMPVLQFSEVLTDEDLLEIIASQSPEKQVAIARRKTVSENVSGALVGTGNERAVTALVFNEGANISERDLQKVLVDLGDREAIQDALVHRPKLPISVAERLVTVVSEKLTGELLNRHNLPEDAVTDLVLQTRERAIISLSSDSDEGDVETLVKQLHKNDRLSPSLILRGLCMGDITFFEVSVAELAGVPLVNARTMIHDSKALGLRTICRKANIPAPQIVAVKAAIEVLREMDYDGRDQDRERFSRRMIERIMTQYDDLGVEFESNDLNYLLTKMNKLPGDFLVSADAA
ncbi:MAG: DUF2336 domain-containing protein [Rhodospirillales bacterium]|nr:DUF2336 domain-containing protein [Rhodospirillales bacterium]